MTGRCSAIPCALGHADVSPPDAPFPPPCAEDLRRHPAPGRSRLAAHAQPRLLLVLADPEGDAGGQARRARRGAARQGRRACGSPPPARGTACRSPCAAAAPETTARRCRSRAGVVLDMARLDQVIWQRPGAGRFGAGAPHARYRPRCCARRARASLLSVHPPARDHRRLRRRRRRRCRLLHLGADRRSRRRARGRGRHRRGNAARHRAARPRRAQGHARLWRQRHHHRGRGAACPEPSLVRADRRFPSLSAAARFAHAFTECDGIAKKLVTVHDPQVVPYLRRLAALCRARRRHGDRRWSRSRRPRHSSSWWRITAARSRSAATPRRRARSPSSRPRACSRSTSSPGTTPRCTRSGSIPTITYLQLRFPPANNLELVDWVAERFRDEVLLHLEFQRRFGKVTCSSLPLVRYTTPRAARRHHGRARSQGRGGLQPAHLRPRQCRLEAGRRAAGRVQAHGRSLSA